MMVALVFGIWLAIDLDAYQLWDGWILASLVLWADGGWAGGKAGKAFEADPVAAAPQGSATRRSTASPCSSFSS